MINDKSFSLPWCLTGAELAVWAVAAVLVCVGATLGHWVQPEESLHASASRGAQSADQGPSPAAWRLDVNTATEAELVLLPGVGPRRAQAIIQERIRRGAFKNIWELSEVPGITKPLLQRLQALLRVDSSAP